MKHILLNLTISAVLLLASGLRFFQLGTNPPALNWDEVAIAWNANTIWELRLDEYGTRLPLAFRSFGDYKSPLYIYGLSPLVGLWGLEPWVVRLPSALAGIMTVGLVGLIAWGLPFQGRQDRWQISVKKANSSRWMLVILSMLGLAISPWHLQFSRGAFEANVALLLITGGIWFALKGIARTSECQRSATWNLKPVPALWLAWVWVGLAMVSFILAAYTYHSPKIFLPLLVIGMGWLFLPVVKHLLLKSWRIGGVMLILGLGMLWPLVQGHLSGEGTTRFMGTSIFYDAQEQPKPLDFSLLSELGKNYLIHFSPSFYLRGQGENLRMGLSRYGLMPIAQWIGFVVGIGILGLRMRTKGLAKTAVSEKFLLLWLLLGFIPAMIGREVPHSLRALNTLPAVILISSVGWVWLWGYGQRWTRGEGQGRWLLLGGTAALILWAGWDYSRYLGEYWTNYRVYAAADWQYGYAQVAKVAQAYESQVDTIIITSSYGQPYIFTLFYQDRQPQLVLWGDMRAYLYRDIQWDGDQFLDNHLLIGTPEEIPRDFPAERGTHIQDIFYPDGSVAFRVVKTRNV